ncbi:hypothetical protein EVAR_83694_1 [Eumeta japonica]|uniref:Uncharacterized protein n=1 Tax=Eumeta variegata TaxID=151549 RepID=A0A4C1XYC5_EUMVA|nr:hypothetical protein EVAR_83694_1 [Eumeta japonica]
MVFCTRITLLQYVQGRVFLRHGRMLRAARVTFPYSKEPYRVHVRRLGPAHCQSTSMQPDSDEERSSPRRNVTNKNAKKVTKQSKKSRSKTPCSKQLIKDVNDNNKHLQTSQAFDTCRFTSISDGSKKSNKLITLTQSEKHISKHTPLDNKSDMKDGKHRQGTRDKAETIKHTDRNHTHKRDKQKDKQKNVAEQKQDDCTKAKQPKCEATETKKLDPIQVKTESSSWTRDEDKTMLQILKGEAGSDQIFGKIREVLPHRSLTDIRERFQHVVSLLQQMAVGEVT